MLDKRTNIDITWKGLKVGRIQKQLHKGSEKQSREWKTRIGELGKMEHMAQLA